MADKTLEQIALTNEATALDVTDTWLLGAFGTDEDWAPPWSVVESLCSDAALAALVGAVSTIATTNLTASRALARTGRVRLWFRPSLRPNLVTCRV